MGRIFDAKLKTTAGVEVIVCTPRSSATIIFARTDLLTRNSDLMGREQMTLFENDNFALPHESGYLMRSSFKISVSFKSDSCFETSRSEYHHLISKPRPNGRGSNQNSLCEGRKLVLLPPRLLPQTPTVKQRLPEP